LQKISAGVCTHQFSQEEVLRMAASSQQGTYLGTTLAGFTAFAAGLAFKGGIGILAAIVGLLLLIISAAGFHKIKDLG